MSKSLIPIRPKGFASNLTQEEQDCCTWYLLSGCNKKDAFLAFARPDMLNSRAQAAIDEYVRQFFARKEVKEYLLVYEQTIDMILHPVVKKVPIEDLEKKKAETKNKLVEFAINLVDNIDMAKDPEMILKMADKLGMLDQEEEKVELPRRYLPVQCGSCAYRQFCEDNTEDMCPHCKYLQECERHGIHFAKTDMLDTQKNKEE